MSWFDRENNNAILLAGIISLIVGVGVARFVYTSLLPPMLDDFLSLTFAGVLASVNYVGYLAGAVFAVFIKDVYAKVKYFRLGMVLCVLSTFVLALTENTAIWLLARVIAGFGAAMALVVGSAIVMTKLSLDDKTKAMGIHFSGIGASILVTDLIARAVFALGEDWRTAWWVLAVFASVLTVYALYILQFDKPSAATHSHTPNAIRFSPLIILLILAYFAEGNGMVVQGTFLPDIINSLPGLEGWGGLSWLLVGLAGIPSCIIWMRLAYRFGSIPVIMSAMLLQIIGILIPTFSYSVYLNLLGGLLYGGTFVGLVALFMHLGGRLAGNNPVLLMGAMTSAYGVGQVVAPLYSVALVNHFGDYQYALYLTALIVAGGVVLLCFANGLLQKHDASK